MDKVLWTFTGAQDDVIDRAKFVGAKAICVRTTVPWLPTAIAAAHAQGLDVYGWRWPAVDPAEKQNHYYADLEAEFVVDLIDKGLDGYIVDAESDSGRSIDDWNQQALAPLAIKFSNRIRTVGKAKKGNFLFGITSGCRFPTQKTNIPWAEFLASSDVAFPQLYWATNITGRHTPADAFNAGMQSWKTIVPAGIPIIPIIGEIETVQAAEIANYSQISAANNLTELHFYTYTPKVPAANWQALQAL